MNIEATARMKEPRNQSQWCENQRFAAPVMVTGAVRVKLVGRDGRVVSVERARTIWEGIYMVAVGSCVIAGTRSWGFGVGNIFALWCLCEG
jgi:hypothetical protein